MMIGIIGLGSPYGDDQAGLKVIEYLSQDENFQKNTENQLTLMALDRPGLKLIDYLQRYEKVILIDGVKSNKPVGTIHCLDNLSQLNNIKTVSTHGFGLQNVLHLCQSLHEMPRKFFIYGIEIADVQTFFSGITPPVKKACLEVATLIKSGLFQNARNVQ